MSGWEQDDQQAKLKQALGEKTPEDVPMNKRKHGLAASLSGSSIPFAPGSTLPRGMKTATAATTIVKPSQSTQPPKRRNTPPPPPTDSSPPKIKITAGFSLSVNKTPPTPVNHKEFVKEDIQQFSDSEQSSHHRVKKETPRNSLPFRSQHSTHSVEISREQERRGNFIESSQSGLNLRETTRGHRANMRSNANMDSLLTVGVNEVASSTNIHQQQNPPNFQRTTRSRKTNQSHGITTVLDAPTAMPSSSSNKRAPPVTASSSPPTIATKTRNQPSRSAKKAPKEPECIELLDDEEEEEVERKKWIKPFLSKIYPINKIYFGAYEQKPVEKGDSNYLRIDGSNNCFVFVFGPEKRENLQFFDIRNYQAGCYDNEETVGYLMIHIHPTTDFQYSVVGQGKSLDPTTAKGYKTRKYISILMPLGEVKELERALANIPSLKSKSGIPTEMDNSLIQILKHLEEIDQQKIEISVMKDLQIKKELFNSDLTGQRVTRRRASVLNSGLPSTYSKEDSRVYVIYPPEIEATDAVTISYGDLRRLEPSIYFNDNLIDLKIKHLISQLPEEKRTKVHAFSCLFYAKLLEAKDPKEQHQLVHRWTKNVDLFSLEFILFPINLRNHWSLMVMARPQAWIDQQLAENEEKVESDNKSGRRLKKGSKPTSENESKRDEDQESNSTEDSPNLGVFLHMDSLRMHPSANIANILGKYLLNEKEAKDNPEKAEEGNKTSVDNEAKESNELIPIDSTASVMIIDNPQAKKEEAEEEAIIMNTDEEGDKTGSEEGAHDNGSSSSKSKRKLSGKKLTSLASPGRRETNCVKCIVPIQENGYDCGVFVIRFAEMILDKWPTTTINDIQDKCHSQFSGEFTQEDIHIERTKIRSLLESLREDWLMKNPEKAKEQREKEGEKEKEKLLNNEVEKDDDKDLYSLDDKDGEAFFHNELTAPPIFPGVQNEDEAYFLQTMPDESNPPSQNKENEEENDRKVGVSSTDYFSPIPLNHSTLKPTAFFSKELFKTRSSKDKGTENDNEKVGSSFKRPVPLTQALQKETDDYIDYNKEEEWEEGAIEELNVTIHLGDSDDNVSTEEQLPPMPSTIPDEDNTSEMMSEQVSDNNDSDDLLLSRVTRKKRNLEEDESVPIAISQQAKKKKKR